MRTALTDCARCKQDKRRQHRQWRMTSTPRKKRARLPPILVMAAAAVVAAVIGLPSAAGFGLSACGASSCAGVRAAAVGAMFTRGLSSCSDFSGTERSWRQEAERARREGERGGGAGWRRRGAHAITCRVASPRKYGSAVGKCYVLHLLLS